MPTTCAITTQLDHIGAVLYLAHGPNIDQVIRDSGKRMAVYYGSEYPWLIADMATQPDTPRNVKVAAFFLLLNVDLVLKQATPRICPYQAGVFYLTLHTSVIPGWLKDERKGVATFVDELRDCYRNS